MSESNPSSGSGLSREGKSVLVEIERLIGTHFRVKLRDLGDQGEVVVETVDLPVRDIGRYQPVGEIAKGGVGVVYRVRDLDLGRDVALKMIRGEYQRDRVVVQRFIEEAQVGGQLQHPGIVPVYELGLREDGAPYFTMKLVKGKTLSEALADRSDPMDSLRKFLAIFEELCHAIAFAHSRGVVHRDIKPANILLGPYGEVMVVDWGFAKVLSRGGVEDEKKAVREQASIIRTIRTEDVGSQSIAGSVMGTPAYMPPEQARGQVEEVDRRSDVFALGAILTEILTGAPAYVAEGTHEVLRMAAMGQLEDAHQRLSRCGQDPKLVQLARACLETDRKKRPRDARVLVSAVSAFQLSVDMRAHQAAMHAAKLRAVSKQATKTRRLVVALAATVLLAVVVGVGVFVQMGHREASRRNEIESRIASALGEATRRARDARKSDDLRLWAQAVEAARQAASFAEDDGADSAQRARVEATLAQLEAGRADAVNRSRRSGANRLLLATLDKIRNAASGDVGYSATDSEYLKAFTDAGISANTLNEEEFAQAVVETGIAAELAPAIDEWAVARRQAYPDRTAHWEKLYHVARLVDPDEWRNELREAWWAGSAVRLASLAESADTARLTPASLVLLSNALGQVGKREPAIRLLRSSQVAHPGDFWINHYLAYWLLQSEHWEEAIRFSLVALALRPNSPATWVQLGIARGGQGDSDAEIAAYREAIQTEPGYARAHYNLALALKQRGSREEAVACLREAIRSDPGYSLAHAALGSWRAEMGEADAAVHSLREAVRHGAGVPALLRLVRVLRDPRTRASAADLRDAFGYADDARRLEPENAACHFELGAVFLMQGRLDEAQLAFERACELAPEYGIAHRSILEVLDSRGRLVDSMNEWRERIQADPEDWKSRARLALGHAKLGGAEAAIEQFEKVVALLPASTWALKELAFVQKDVDLSAAAETYRRAVALDPADALAWNDLGATLHRLGRSEEATQAYRKAIALDPLDAVAHFNLAFITGESSQTGESLNAYRNVLRLQPTHYDALDQFTRLCYQRGAPGDLDAAVEACARALRLQPESYSMHLVFGLATGYRFSLKEGMGFYRETVGTPDPKLEAGFLNNFAVARGRAGFAEEDREAQLRAAELNPESALFLRNAVLAWIAVGDADGAVAYARERLRANPRLGGARDALTLALDARGDPDLAVEAWREAVRLLSTSEEDAPPAVAGGEESPASHPGQATGPAEPQHTRHGGTCGRAWRAAVADGAEAWLELTYDPPLRAHMVRIWEVNVAGGVTRVEATDAGGDWRTVWEGEDTLLEPGVLELSFETTAYEIRKLRIFVDTARKKGWEQIDAVELIGPDGRAWASGAAASSIYGQSELFEVQSLLVNALSARGLPADREETVRLALASARSVPALERLHRDLGVVLGRTGEIAAGLATWEQEFPRASSSLRSSFLQGFSAGAAWMRRLDVATEAALQAAGIDPESHLAAYWAGLSLATRAGFEDAGVTWITRVVGAPVDATAEFYRGLGFGYGGRMRWAEAVAAWKRVVELAPDHENLIAHLVALGLMQQRTGDLGAADLTLRDALRRNPSNASLYRRLGDLAVQRGDLDAAVQDYRSGLARTRYDAWGNYHLGIVLIERGETEAGLEAILRAPLSEGIAERRRWEVEGQRMLELRDRASGILSGNARPADASNAFDYARLCWYSGFDDVAVTYYERAFELDPYLVENPELGARHAAARAAVRAKRFDRARAWLEEELSAWETRLAERSDAMWTNAPEEHFRFHHPASWDLDWALIPVRDAAALAKLPAAEREKWQALWARVDAFLRDMVASGMAK